MTIEQLITQWNASIENAQQQPDSQTSQADLPQPDSAVQVRTGVTAGKGLDPSGRCSYSLIATTGCW
jgi:hypothetical protein